MQPALFSQLVVVPLFTDHRVLSQVAGHGLNVIKGLPPLVLSEEDVDWFVEALDATLAAAQKLPRATARFALRAPGPASDASAPSTGVRHRLDAASLQSGGAVSADGDRSAPRAKFACTWPPYGLCMNWHRIVTHST